MIEYNLAYLEELAAGDNAFLLSMVSDFIQQTPDTLEHISDAINKNDCGTIYQLVHRFIPSLEYIGVNDLVRKFRDIEQLAKAKAEISIINSHFEQAKKDIFSLIEKLKLDFNQ